MGVNRNPGKIPPARSEFVAGNETAILDQDPDSDKLATTAVKRKDGNIAFSDWDLVGDGDLVIPDDISGLDSAPFIGGGTQSVLGVESTDDNQFSIKFEYGIIDSNGDFQVRFTYDKNDDSDLDSDSSYIVLINVVLDHIKVTLSDTSGAGTNTIQGGLNSH